MKQFTDRREYQLAQLNENQLTPDPIKQLDTWLNQAIEHPIQDANAMVLSTLNTELEISARVVLLKQIDQTGLTFYTSLNSEKAQDIRFSNKVSVLFPWLALDRQVRIKGIAEPIPTHFAKLYFQTRPRNSQLTAWVNSTSLIADSKQYLKHQYQYMKQKFLNQQIPMPDNWGGYIIKPHYFEFWQGGEARLHDRLCYQICAKTGWKISRLV